MALTTDATKQILQKILTGSGFVPPTFWYIGLSKTQINNDGSGVTEPGESAYQRIKTTSEDWVMTESGEIRNSKKYTFPVISGDILCIFLSTGPKNDLNSKIFYYQNIKPTIKVVTEKVTIPIGGITVRRRSLGTRRGENVSH